MVSRGTAKFLRHLAAVLVVVGVVVALAMVWQHVSSPGLPGAPVGRPAGSVIRGGRPVSPHGRQVQEKLAHIRVRPGGGPGLTLARFPDVIRYLLVQVLVMGVVVAISAGSRRRRAARRLRMSG